MLNASLFCFLFAPIIILAFCFPGFNFFQMCCRRYSKKTSEYFQLNDKMSRFQHLTHLICSLCSTWNKIWLYEICKSLYSVFICVKHSIPIFLELGLFKKKKSQSGIQVLHQHYLKLWRLKHSRVLEEISTMWEKTFIVEVKAHFICIEAAR